MHSRRSKDMNGYVNFPVDNPDFPNSREGGMFVRLVVVEKEYGAWMVCCGGHTDFLMDEEFMGDDVHPREEIEFSPPEGASKEEIELWFANWNRRNFGAAGNFHFPDCYPAQPISEEAARHNKAFEEIYGSAMQYRSLAYLAVINIGSTGWSNGDWRCRYEDLTEKGKALYDSLKDLYGDGCQIYLQTWLDT